MAEQPNKRGKAAAAAALKPLDPILRALQRAATRPEPTALSTEKKNYAERLSRQIATELANALRKSFPGITPDSDGKRQEQPARGARGLKKLDVNYSTSELGLGLGVSVKTINFRDPTTKRYTKNYSRNDNELRAEAKDYHQRQPYAVLVAIVFLPVDSAHDGKKDPSSFGAAVQYFRFRAARERPTDEPERFERVFIGLYDSAKGSIGFWDVLLPPPKQGLPPTDKLLAFDAMIGEIVRTYDERNNPPALWADGQVEPVDPDAFEADEQET